MPSLYERYEQYLGYLKRTNTFIHNYALGISLGIRFHLQLEPLDEQHFLKMNQNITMVVGGYYSGKTQCLLWDDKRDYPVIFEHIDLAMKYIEGVVGLYQEREMRFATTMLLLSAHYDGYMDTLSPDLQTKYQTQIQQNVAYIESLAESCPPNEGHKELLVKAELAKVEGRPMDACILYEEARKSAQTHMFLQYEALTNELAGKFWHSQGIHNPCSNK